MEKLLTILFFSTSFFSHAQTKASDSSNATSRLLKELDYKIHFRQKEKKDIYEFPSDLRGPVTVFTSESCGQKIVKRKGSNVIKLPNDGVLILKDDRLEFSYDVNDGGQVFEYRPNIYYLVDFRNQKTELPELDHIKFDEGTEQKYSTEQIGVFALGLVSGVTYRPDTISYSYSEFFIGSYKDLKSSNYQLDKGKKDKEAIDKLRKCRGL